MIVSNICFLDSTDTVSLKITGNTLQTDGTLCNDMDSVSQKTGDETTGQHHRNMIVNSVHLNEHILVFHSQVETDVNQNYNYEGFILRW